MPTKFIQIENISIYRLSHLVLENISWTIETDQHWIITGNNGVGKTSLAGVLAGKHYRRGGQINYHFLAKAVKKGQSIYELKRQAIRFVTFSDTHQSFNNREHYYQQRFNAFDADGGITVLEYLKETGFQQQNANHQNIIQQTGVDKLLHLHRVKLSSGQTRKLLITTAILQQPQLLIIDNPYIGLDKQNRQLFNVLLDDLAFHQNIKIILCGHYHELPRCITHRLHLVNHQQFVSGQIATFKNPEQKRSVNQLALPIIQQYYQTFRWKTTYNHAIWLKGIDVKYRDNHVLKKLDWQVKQGEKWALIGPNGSGKSTILGMIAADHPQVYANDVYIFDKKRGNRDSIWDIKAKIGFISPELHAYFSYEGDHTCFDIVASGLFTTSFEKRPLTNLEKMVIQHLFLYFDKTTLHQKSFYHLSTGEQRLVLLLKALVKNPPLLLMDEPFQGLDSITIERAKYLFNHILTKHHTLIFITHYEDEIPSCVEEYFKL